MRKNKKIWAFLAVGIAMLSASLFHAPENVRADAPQPYINLSDWKPNASYDSGGAQPPIKFNYTYHGAVSGTAKKTITFEFLTIYDDPGGGDAGPPGTYYQYKLQGAPYTLNSQTDQNYKKVGICQSGLQWTYYLYVNKNDLSKVIYNFDYTHSSGTCLRAWNPGSPLSIGGTPAPNPGDTSGYVTALQNGIQTKNLQFQDRFTITTKFDFPDKTGTQDAKFVDNDPEDSTFNYVPVGNIKDYLCNTSSISIPGMYFNKLGGYETVDLKAEVHLHYENPYKPGDCKTISVDTTASNGPAVGNPNDNASLIFSWGGSDGTDLKRVDDKGGTFSHLQSTVGGDNVYRDGDNPCSNVLIVKSDKSGVVYDLDPSSGSGTNTDFPDLTSIFKSLGTCHVQRVNIATPLSNGADNNKRMKVLATKTFIIGGTKGQGAAVADQGATNNTCEASYTGAAHALNWIFCSVLEGMDSLFNSINSLVEGQLFFCTGASSTIPSQNTCKNNLLTSEVQKVWSLFRVIATSILVIIMLIMVISQAIGGAGPIDAYTVRKLLPKLIFAAIFMQLSWYFFKWTIDLSNDIGRGIADLMFYPFGGSGQFALDNLIGGTSTWAPAVTITLGGVGTGLLLAFSGLTPIGIGFLFLSVIASVIVAVFVLLMRQILIILCMILAPVAIVAWILPGTNRYWKLWQDNFTKLIFMFPMIMAMIAAGRIFALIGGHASRNSGHYLSGIIIVLFGYFAPYWFLPKTFKWGGTAFAALSGAIWSGSQKGRNFPGKYALDKAKENRQQRAHDRAENLAEGTSHNPRWDRFLAGRYNMVRSRRGRLRGYQNTLSEGRKAAEEAVPRTLLDSSYEGLDHTEKLQVLELVAQGQADTRHGTGLTGVDPAQQRWALDQLATYGDWDIISSLRDRDLINTRTWEAFVAKNISAINQKAAHLSPLKADLSRVPTEEMTNWHSSEFNELEEQAVQGYVRDPRSGGHQTIRDPQELRAHRLRMIASAQRALANSQIADRIGEDQRAVLERIAAMEVDNPDVVTLRGRTLLPSGAVLQTDPTARGNLTQAMGGEASAPPGEPKPIIGEVAQRLADRSGTPTNLADLPGLQDYMRDLESEAGAIDPRTGGPASPQAKNTYNIAVTAYYNAVDQRAATQERELLHQGLSDVQLARERRRIQTVAANDKALFPSVP